MPREHALHVLFAPEVCLMLCCDAPSAVAAAEDDSHLPPCHRKPKSPEKNAVNSPTAFHAPCSHTHDAKPTAWQRANDESSLSLLSAALVVVPFAWQVNDSLRTNHRALLQPTVSPPFRERNLPLRI